MFPKYTHFRLGNEEFGLPTIQADGEYRERPDNWLFETAQSRKMDGNLCCELAAAVRSTPHACHHSFFHTPNLATQLIVSRAAGSLRID